MCGINGFNFSDEALILKMNEVTKHRGPDATGHFVDESVSLGHNLLAITERPENSRQPFVSPDKNYVLIYNGEIYNYKELRDELKRDGDSFSTNSDTEVLFKGLIRHGPTFIEKLDGMFAFAFYDKAKQNLLLSRDSSGVKPLYYAEVNGRLIFSSEMRGILAHDDVSRQISYDALNIFFVMGYVAGPLTLVKSIFKVCPGQCLELDLKSKTLRKSWVNLGKRYDEEAVFTPELFREKIHRAVEGHTLGLRPLGLYLSGGLDSSTIFYELFKEKGKALKTFTTRFDVNDQFFNSDADIAKRMTTEYGNDHYELLVKEDDFVDAIEPMIECIEHPRWVPHIATQWLLARQASQDIVVVLNGSGGDELFLGYEKHFNSKKIHDYYKTYPRMLVDLAYTLHGMRKGRVRAGKFLPLSNVMYRWAYVNNVWFHLPKDWFLFPYRWGITDVAKHFLSISAPPIVSPLPDEENAMGDYDRFFWLADEEFLRTDKMTMHYGMEGRFPLLARDVQRYANSIPSTKKISKDLAKLIVREAYKGFLPDYVINKAKTGWKSPVTIWMKGKLGTMVKEALSRGYNMETESLFNFEKIRNLMANNSDYSIAACKKFMPIFSFQIWARQMKIRL